MAGGSKEVLYCLCAAVAADLLAAVPCFRLLNMAGEHDDVRLCGG
jgi:hypothetical protein